jgi:peptidoglycan L-alanyl-D-glutamate endopeptidase CwlK
MTPKDEQKLRGVHPRLIAAVEVLLAQMATIGHPMMVAQGLRTTKQQQELYAKGRTTKGPRVTNADGIKAKSNHQAKDDGFGHAVDLAFVAPEPFADSHPWTEMGVRAERLGLKWGGRWTSFPDRPHVELPPEPIDA